MSISSISAGGTRSGRGIRGLIGCAAVLLLLLSGRMSVRADSTGQVTGTTVNVRQSASVNSTAIASVARGDTVTIKSQTTGTDGNTWYEIVVNGTGTGYIRADFVSITDGSTPETSAPTTTTTTPTTTTAAVNTEGMTTYTPVSAKVSGGQTVRVRADATTNSEIIATLASGHDLTVSGSKSLTDGFTWYYVTFVKDNQTISGYMRSEYVTLSGELVEGGGETTPEEPAGSVEAPAEPSEEQPAETVTVDPSAPYAVQLQTDQTDGVEKWFLLDREGNLSEDHAAYAYGIEKIFEERTQNAEMIASQKKKLRTARVWMVIFLILMIAAVAAAVYFFLEWRKQSDQAAFAEAERNRRSRGTSRGQSGSAAGSGRSAQGTRTQGGTSGGAQRQQTARGEQRQQGASNGQRPSQGSSQRPQRPQQGGSGSQRSRQTAGGERSDRMERTERSERSERAHEGARSQTSSQRPEQGESRTRAQQGGGYASGQPASRTGGDAARQQERQNQQRAKARNLAEDDDEFEFGFLNWDDDDK